VPQEASEGVSWGAFPTEGNRMPKINVLATAFGQPIRTKAALKQLIGTSPETVKLLPADKPTPLTERVRMYDAYVLPSNVTALVHSPTGRNWTAELSRKETGSFLVK
jgi:hypothetical protein